MLLSVVAAMSEATIAINGTITLGAVRAFFSNPVDSLRWDVTWSSGDPTIAFMDDNGVFVGMRSGTTTLRGTLSTGGSATVMLTVSERCDRAGDPPRPDVDATPEVKAAFRRKQCLQEFGDTNVTRLRAIRLAAESWRRNPSGMSAEAVEQCSRAFAAVDSMLSPAMAPVSFWMGRDSSFVVRAPGDSAHNAQAEPGQKFMHFDPNFWWNNIGSTSGQRKILTTLLHEAVHAMIGRPGNPYGDHGSGSTPNYHNYAFFKYLEIPGPNSCLLPEQ